jgi:hypothetical protein
MAIYKQLYILENSFLRLGEMPPDVRLWLEADVPGVSLRGQLYPQ